MEFLSFETVMLILVSVFITGCPAIGLARGMRPIGMHAYTLPGSVAMLFGFYCTYWTPFILVSYLFAVVWFGLVALSLIFLEPARQAVYDHPTATSDKSSSARIFLIKK